MRIKNQRGFTTLGILLVIVVVGALCGTVGYVVSQNKQEKTQTTSRTTSELPKEEAQTSTNKLPELVDYGERGVEILQKSDVSKLTQTSDTFKSYIASLVGEKPTKTDGCDQFQKTYVIRVYKDEFAYGGTSGCGGIGIIWNKEGDNWKKIWGGQTALPCSKANEYKIPHQLQSECQTEDATVNNGIISNPN
jgi:type II secretory pathway pseudopilin PulG